MKSWNSCGDEEETSVWPQPHQQSGCPAVEFWPCPPGSPSVLLQQAEKQSGHGREVPIQNWAHDQRENESAQDSHSTLLHSHHQSLVVQAVYPLTYPGLQLEQKSKENKFKIK